MQNKKTIHETFNNIAKRYDLLNSLLTFGLDKLWRRQLTKRIPNQCSNILDVATGTGDQIISILKRKKQVRKIFGLDMSEKMLQKAYQKIARYSFYKKVTFLHGSSTNIPLDDIKLDCITLSFGMRNFDEQEKALHEMYRLLKPGAKLLILEFLRPSQKITPLFNFFMKNIASPVGRLISKNKDAYNYLFESIKEYYSPSEFETLLKSCGFNKVKKTNLFLSIVYIFEVTK